MQLKRENTHTSVFLLFQVNSCSLPAPLPFSCEDNTGTLQNMWEVEVALDLCASVS